MTALLTSSNACTQTAGKGMITTWTLTGSDYTGDLTTTDGYQLAAAMTWQAVFQLTADHASAANNFTNGNTNGILKRQCDKATAI